MILFLEKLKNTLYKYGANVLRNKELVQEESNTEIETYKEITLNVEEMPIEKEEVKIQGLNKFYVNKFDTIIQIPKNKICLQSVYNLKSYIDVLTIDNIYQEVNILKHRDNITISDNQCEVDIYVDYRQVNVTVYISFKAVLALDNTCNDYVYAYEGGSVVGDNITYCLSGEDILYNFEPSVDSIEMEYLGLIEEYYFFKVSGEVYINQLPPRVVEEALSDYINLLLSRVKNSIITQYELEKITEIYLYNMELINLYGLQYMCNLIRLYIAENNITDISYIENLIQLLELDISNNLLGTPQSIHLSKLTNLKYLDISNTNINSLDSIENCTQLVELYFFENSISSLYPIRNMILLEFINAGNNNISDLTYLLLMQNLKFIDLFNNNISDLTSISSLSNLENINLAFNKISNIEKLSTLTNLKSINLTGNEILDLTPIDNLDNLIYFTAQFQNIVLPSVSIGLETEYTLDLSIIKNIDGSTPTTIEDITPYGEYNQTLNTIKWSGITSTINTSFKFIGNSDFYGTINIVINK